MNLPELSFYIKGKDAIIQKLVFEVRYDYGFAYLDRCGRTVNTIMREYPEWVVRSSDPSPQNAPLVSLANSCVFNFSALRYDFALERTPGDAPFDEVEVSEFIQQVESVSTIVGDVLELRDYTRAGFRVWYLFPFDSSQMAEEWLRTLGAYEVSSRFLEAFESGVQATTAAIVMEGEDRRFRVAFSGVELQTQVDLGKEVLQVRPRQLHKKQREHLKKQMEAKRRIRQNPEHAAMIDVDVSLDHPPAAEPSEFVITSLEQIRSRLTSALGGT